MFDALGPVRDTGQDVEQSRPREWFGAYRSAIDFQVQGTMTDDTVVDMWVRATVGFRRGEDGWKIVHEHSSVPLTPSGTAGD